MVCFALSDSLAMYDQAAVCVYVRPLVAGARAPHVYALYLTHGGHLIQAELVAIDRTVDTLCLDELVAYAAVLKASRLIVVRTEPEPVPVLGDGDRVFAQMLGRQALVAGLIVDRYVVIGSEEHVALRC